MSDREQRPKGSAPLPGGKTWPEVPSSIERSALASTASVQTIETQSGIRQRPMRAAYRAPDANFQALCAAALRHARTGRVDDGLRMALVCIEEEPLHHGGYLAAATIQQERGRFHEAEVLLRRVILILPDLVEGHVRLQHVREQIRVQVAGES